MALTSIGDLAQSLMLRRSMASTKTEIHRLTQESTTGVVSDPARHLSGDLGALSALRADLRRTEGFQTARATVQLHVDGQQTVLQRLNTRATELSASLVSAGDTGQSMTLSTMALNARAALSEAVSALNTQVAGRSLFSGKTTDRPALPSAEALLASLGAITGGLSSAADIEAAVDGWFSSTAGFASAYGGDDPIGRVAIARGQEADLNLTAEVPAIRDTLRGSPWPRLRRMPDCQVQSGPPWCRPQARRCSTVRPHVPIWRRSLLSRRTRFPRPKPRTAVPRPPWKLHRSI